MVIRFPVPNNNLILKLYPVDLPSLNTFLSFSETDTEKSEFCSIEVLDETADSKATVLKTLNILH
jgi:hypothetical protein